LIFQAFPMSDRPIRNIAIIAHVDHGKTTLVDKLLRQSGTFAAHQHLDERVMDSNDLEKERGITILAKNTSVEYQGIHINIVDTPGHADFGGEVERVLGMVDGVLLLVDAVEGPMPQTRFVTKKALALGLRPIVVVNKVDRDGANPDNAVNLTFDLFDKLGASDEQLDFPIVYASALNGWAALDLAAPRDDMKPLFETVLSHVPAPDTDVDAPLQFQISALDYSSYVGRIGIGRIKRGRVRTGQQVLVMFGTAEEASEHERTPFKAKVGQVFGSGTEPGRARRRPRRRHRPDHRHRGPRPRVHGRRPRESRATAAAEDRRADAGNAVPGQHQPARRDRGQVRHQPADPRPPAQGTADQHGAARA
jgi:GTP-binding protein